MTYVGRSSASLCLLFAFMLAPGGAGAVVENKVRAAQVVLYGTYETLQRKDHQDALAGSVSIDTVGGVYFTTVTDQILASPGVGFGLQFVIHASSADAPVVVETVIRFPEGGLRLPDGSVRALHVVPVTVVPGRATLHGFRFDHGWEITPGEWQFEIHHNNRTLVSRSFDVVRDAPIDENGFLAKNVKKAEQAERR